MTKFKITAAVLAAAAIITATGCGKAQVTPPQTTNNAVSTLYEPNIVETPPETPTIGTNSNVSLVSEGKGWSENSLTDGLPRLKADGIISRRFNGDNGTRINIIIPELSYKDYLKYIAKVERAGFTDYTSHAHIPDEEPSGSARFYHAFDGERAIGIYWNGEESKAEFTCEIVITNY